MRKIRVGDEVICTAGRSKGRRGKVLQINLDKKNPKRGYWAKVEGLNLVKKHIKGNPQTNTEGRIAEIEGVIHLSNIALYNPISHRADRVGIKQLDDGRKVRYFKSDGEVVDVLES